MRKFLPGEDEGCGLVCTIVVTDCDGRGPGAMICSNKHEVIQDYLNNAKEMERYINSQDPEVTIWDPDDGSVYTDDCDFLFDLTVWRLTKELAELKNKVIPGKWRDYPPII